LNNSTITQLHNYTIQQLNNSTTQQFNNSTTYASRQLARSACAYFQGAPLFSMFPNMVLRLAGACDSSMTAYRLSSTMISSGLILTGHASTQALQVVQAQISSRVM